MFKAGDQVKVFIKLGLQRQQTWQKGVVVATVGGNTDNVINVDFNGVVVNVVNEPYGNVLKFEPLSQEEWNAWGHVEFPKVTEMLKNAVKHFYGDKYEIEISEECVSIGKTIFLQPAAIEQKSIGRIKENPGWSVSTLKYLHATHWEPEDYEPVELGETRSTAAAVQMAIQHFHNIVHINPYFEQLADEEYAKQLAEEPEYF